MLKGMFNRVRTREHGRETESESKEEEIKEYAAAEDV